MLWVNKFILKGDEINPNNDTGTPIMWKEKGHEIKWKGLTDKNSDKQYAPRQLLPQSDYDA